MAIKTGVIGAAGFAGVELVRVLLGHPEFKLVAATSNELAGKPIAEEYPAFTGRTKLAFCTHDDPAVDACELVFLAVPHTAAMNTAPRFLERGCVVVDLSADFRLEDPAVYEQWYKVKHTQTEWLAKRAFGLPELFPDDLARAAKQHSIGQGVLVGCAGCYPTCTSLAAAPACRNGLVKSGSTVVADAISGVTGAGKKATARTHYCFANENLEAYGVTTHRHTPEIEQILGIEGRLVFTPHLAPLNRGLLSTVTMKLADGVQPVQVYDAYETFYGTSPFVTVLKHPAMPRTFSVAGSNCAQVGVAVDTRTGNIVAVGAIDNLGKGAADQAVQCANIVFGLPETAGLLNLTTPV